MSISTINPTPFFVQLAPGIRTPVSSNAGTSAGTTPDSTAENKILPPVTPASIFNNKATDKFDKYDFPIVGSSATTAAPGTVEAPTVVPERVVTQNGTWVRNPLLVAADNAPATIVDRLGKTIANPAKNYISELKAKVSTPVNKTPTEQGSDIKVTLPSGTVSGLQDDEFYLSELVQSKLPKSNPSFDAIVGYRVAIRNQLGGTVNGQLVINKDTVLNPNSDGTYTVNVNDFNSLRYKVNSVTGTDELVISAFTGTYDKDKDQFNPHAYSNPIQINFKADSKRSLNGEVALKAIPNPAADPVASLVVQSNVYVTSGGLVVPNAQAKATEFGVKSGSFALLSDLFQASLPKEANNQKISGYKLAISDSTAVKITTASGVEIVPDAKGIVSLTVDDFLTALIKVVGTTEGSETNIAFSAISTKTDNNRNSLGTSYSTPLLVDLTVAKRTDSQVRGIFFEPPPPVVVPPIVPIVDGTNYIEKQSVILSLKDSTKLAQLSVNGNIETGANDWLNLGKFINTKPAKDPYSVIGVYQVALSDAVSGGSASGGLRLDGVTLTPNINGYYELTRDEFARVQLQSGAKGTATTVTVNIRNDILNADGKKSPYYSPTVSFVNSVTDVRSLNAIAHLDNLPQIGGKADRFSKVVQDAVVNKANNEATKINLNTVGNFNLVKGDSVRLSNLFNADTKVDKGVTNYLVAIRDATSGSSDLASGSIILDGEIVAGDGYDATNLKTPTIRTSFSADEFARLLYKYKGKSDDIVVAAQSSPIGLDGKALVPISSPAVSINASSTKDGLRSLNIASTVKFAPDASGVAPRDPFYGIAQTAEIFRGTGGEARPQVTTRGNFTTAEGATLTVANFISAKPAIGKEIVAYNIAIKQTVGLAVDGGSLILNGKIVAGAAIAGFVKLATEQTSFTPDELSQLQYRVGKKDSKEQLIVAAESVTRDQYGKIVNRTSSSAQSFSNTVTGNNSINIAGIANNTITGYTDGFTEIVKLSSQYSNNPKHPAPTLTTRIHEDLASIELKKLVSSTTSSNSFVNEWWQFVDSTEGFEIGNLITGPNIPDGAIINDVDPANKYVAYSPALTGTAPLGSIIYTKSEPSFKVTSFDSSDPTLLHLDSVQGLSVDDSIYGLNIDIGTKIINVDPVAKTIIISGAGVTGTLPANSKIFTKVAVNAITAEGKLSNAIGRSTSTQAVDPTKSYSYGYSQFTNPDSRHIINRNYDAPGSRLFNTQLLLLNSEVLGGYESSDSSQINRIIGISNSVQKYQPSIASLFKATV